MYTIVLTDRRQNTRRPISVIVLQEDLVYVGSQIQLLVAHHLLEIRQLLGAQDGAQFLEPVQPQRLRPAT